MKLLRPFLAALLLTALILAAVGAAGAYKIAQIKKTYPDVSIPDIKTVLRSFSPGKADPYTPAELSYIKDYYTGTDRELLLSVGMNDIWGNPYMLPGSLKVPGFVREYWFDFGENPKKHNNVPDSMARLAGIGSEAVMITDFAIVKKGIVMQFQDDRTNTCATMTRDELGEFAAEAKKIGLEVVMITNLVDDQFVRQRLEAFTRGKNLYDQIPEGALAFDRFNMAMEDLKKLHDQWKIIMAEQADKAQSAGVEYLVIDARDASWVSLEQAEYENMRYGELVKEVRGRFKGKVGMAKSLEFWTATRPFVKELDFVIISEQVEKIMDGASAESLESITKAWQRHFMRPEFKHLTTREVIQEVLMPSYTGAMKKGWIEPGGHYPDLDRDFKEQALVYEGLFRALHGIDRMPVTGVMSYGYNWNNYLYPQTFEIRTDLSHSIRNKDAEHVFHRWAGIFK